MMNEDEKEQLVDLAIDILANGALDREIIISNEKCNAADISPVAIKILSILDFPLIGAIMMTQKRAMDLQK